MDHSPPPPSYTLITISSTKPLTQKTLSQYRTIRLLSLKSDPLAFGSTYEQASQLSLSQWKDRLLTPGRTTLGIIPTITNTNNNNNNTNDDDDNNTNEWIATASLLSPSMLKSIGYSPPKELLFPTPDYNHNDDPRGPYMIVGMWVNPTYRRKGLAKTLIKALLFDDSDEAEDNNNSGKSSKRVLQVTKTNYTAIAFYPSVGFQFLPSPDPDPVRPPIADEEEDRDMDVARH